MDKVFSKNAFSARPSAQQQRPLNSGLQQAQETNNVSTIADKFKRKPDEWANHMLRVANDRDRKAFAELFNHFGPKVKSYALMLRNVFTSPDMAEELVQDVMIKVWLKADSFNPEKASVNTWLFTIARNARTDILRKVNRGDLTFDNDAAFNVEDEVEPIGSLEILRAQENVQMLLHSLPDEQAEVIKQIYLQGKSHSQLAEETGVPLGTVKSRVRLAMAKMRTILPDNHEDLV